MLRDTVTKLRSDNGGEYMGQQFKQVLIDNKIKHNNLALIHHIKMALRRETGVPS